MEILQIKNLKFAYPDAQINTLENINTSVHRGEFIVICGESGCGKTTLLKLLKKEIAPYGTKSGEIFFNGTEQNFVPSKISASEIGFVLQSTDAQIVTDFVYHELAFGLENLGMDNQIIRRRVSEMANYFGIQDWFRKKTNELSGGQKQLLNLASVMSLNPKLLLLDEPTAQLDPIAASNFIATLNKLNKELGLTIIIIEHRLEEILPIADRVWLLEKGNLVFDGAPKNIISFFNKNPSHKMLTAMPSAMRIFASLNGVGDCPLTVREGREYITKNFSNDISCLPSAAKKLDSEPVVELKNVYFRYRRDFPDALNGLDLTVKKAEHFCILGGNGTGKTTTLSVISGLKKPYRGKILINGKNIEEYKNGALYQNNLAYLPQNPQNVFVANTVYEDLYEICKNLKKTKEESEKIINAIAEKLNLSSLLQMHPYDLSGGEQQKAALAKMLLLNPKILLLDEPTKGIDDNAKQNFIRIIKQLNSDGVTVITVTHDIEFAAESADRCGLFFDGEMVSVDIPENFFSENNFYTTSANRISRGYFKNAITSDQVVELCRKNEKKAVRDE